MKTRLTTRPSSLRADGTLSLHVPHSWAELTQAQLRYVLTLLSKGWGEWQMRTYLFARFSGISVLKEKKDGWLCETRLEDGKRLRFFLQLWQVQSFCDAFGYIFDGEGADNRLDHIGRYKAVDVELHGVAYSNYLTADNYFQGFLESNKTDLSPLRNLARCLYLDSKGREPEEMKCTDAELMGVFLWFMWVKQKFSTSFPHLFKPASDGGGGDYDPRAAMDAQIRALTGGDVTKEEQILCTDVWRALTELDAKAREAEELNEQMKKS